MEDIVIACPACPDRFFARGRFLRLAVPLTALLFALAACESGRVQNTGGGLQGGPPAAAQQPARTVPLETAVPPPIPAGAPAAVPAAAPKVAILLPLTGPSAQVGRALLDAAQVALFDIGDDALILLPRDTGGTADGAARAAEAALADGARLIIGPLFAAEVAAVTAKTRAAGINVVSLSQRCAPPPRGLTRRSASSSATIRRRPTPRRSSGGSPPTRRDATPWSPSAAPSKARTTRSAARRCAASKASKRWARSASIRCCCPISATGFSPSRPCCPITTSTRRASASSAPRYGKIHAWARSRR
ncbi:MAG: ABC transporter substrate-binding protein [Rhodospirillales bacterium]|nr:ABC transporter substrate-binding protein [Rhodospirillales bacterium]